MFFLKLHEFHYYETIKYLIEQQIAAKSQKIFMALLFGLLRATCGEPGTPKKGAGLNFHNNFLGTTTGAALQTYWRIQVRKPYCQHRNRPIIPVLVRSGRDFRG